MLYWVIYDITKNAKRHKVSERCKDYGLVRIQKSSFIGRLTKNKAEMLMLDLQKILEGEDDCVFMIPACTTCYQDKILIGTFDESVLDKKEFIIIGDTHV